MSNKAITYWDACIFISYFQNEPRPNPDDMLGVLELVEQFDRNQIDIVASTITITEVLKTKTISDNPDGYEKFKLFLSQRNLHLIDVTKTIAIISHEIRDYYFEKFGKAILETPDCIHLATAIWFKCDSFYTFDGDGNKTGGLLTLANPIADQYNLSIKKPMPSRPSQLKLGVEF